MATRRTPFNELKGLAAAYAALDPSRYKSRSDILISSVIEVLAPSRPMPERTLHQQIKKLWVTDAVDAATLRVALESAERAGLVASSVRGNETRWAATPTSADEAKADQKWVRDLLAQFEQDVGQRLDEHLAGPEKPEAARIPRLASYLVDALIAGSQRVLRGVAQANDPENLEAIEFDHVMVAEHLLKRVHPRYVAKSLIALATAVADWRDPFGTELLRLIVRGQVLHGMLAYRDLKGPTPVQGSLLLLDTSVLVYRLEYSGPNPRILEEFLKMSADARCDVVVTRAVIDEWNTLWRHARDDAMDLENASTNLPPPCGRFAHNPVLRSWLSRTDGQEQHTWANFEKQNLKIENWLTARGVRVIEAGAADPALVERIRTELASLSEAARKMDVKRKAKRTPAAARTDAYSAALVAEERERASTPLPVPHAWFIAKDHLSNKAYSAIQTRDRFPIACTLETWLLLLSAGDIDDDPERTRDLADIVADSAIRNSFLTVSANYEPEQLKDILELLGQDPGATADDLAQAFRADLLSLATSTGTDVATEVARRRLRHREEQFQRTKRTLQASGDGSPDDRAKDLEDDNRRLRSKLDRWRRTAGLMGSIVIIVAGVLASALAGAPGWMVAAGAVGGVAFCFEGLRWVTNPAVRNVEFICAVGAMVAWSVFSSVLGPAFNHSPPARSVHQVQLRIAPSAARASPERSGRTSSSQKRQRY